MPDSATDFPRYLILTAAMVCGALLALAVYMLGQRFGLDIAGLWSATRATIIPASAGFAWWLIATVAFAGGFATATLMNGAASGHISRTMWQFLIGVLVLVLAAAGQAAAAPTAVPTAASVLAGVAALVLGTGMAFCGAHFAADKVRPRR